MESFLGPFLILYLVKSVPFGNSDDDIVLITFLPFKKAFNLFKSFNLFLENKIYYEIKIINAINSCVVIKNKLV